MLVAIFPFPKCPPTLYCRCASYPLHSRARMRVCACLRVRACLCVLARACVRARVSVRACVCACECACVCVRVRVRACVCVCGWVGVGVWVCCIHLDLSSCLFWLPRSRYPSSTPCIPASCLPTNCWKGQSAALGIFTPTNPQVAVNRSSP